MTGRSFLKPSWRHSIFYLSLILVRKKIIQRKRNEGVAAGQVDLGVAYRACSEPPVQPNHPKPERE